MRARFIAIVTLIAALCPTFAMTAPTPEGPLSLPYVGLAELMSQSTRFQEVVGVEEAEDPVAAALEFIHYPSLTVLDDVFAVPLAILSTELDLDMQLWKRGAPGGKLSTGQLMVQFLFPADPDLDDENDQFLAYINDVGMILREMLDKANTKKTPAELGYYWNLIQLDQAIAPGRCDPKILRAVLAGSDPPERATVYASAWVARWV